MNDETGGAPEPSHAAGSLGSMPGEVQPTGGQEMDAMPNGSVGGLATGPMPGEASLGRMDTTSADADSNGMTEMPGSDSRGMGMASDGGDAASARVGSMPALMPDRMRTFESSDGQPAEITGTFRLILKPA